MAHDDWFRGVAVQYGPGGRRAVREPVRVLATRSGGRDTRVLRLRDFRQNLRRERPAEPPGPHGWGWAGYGRWARSWSRAREAQEATAGAQVGAGTAWWHGRGVKAGRTVFQPAGRVLSRGCSRQWGLFWSVPTRGL
jgi:hypothetical protein